MLPNSATIQSTLRKVVAAITGVVLALVLLTALLVTGFYFLVNAAALALAPLVGKPGAMAITGFTCLCLLALFFYRMTRPAKSGKESEGGTPASGSGSPIEVLRSLIAQNPLEAAALAFAVGVAEQADPRLKNLLLQGGMVLMRQAPNSASSKPRDSADSSVLPADKPSVE